MVIVGVQAPAALLASFVPMFLIAGAFFYMNRADRDAGTTFSWVTRTLGPWFGWIGGWAVCTTGILVIGSLADVGARYTYLLFGADGAAGSKAAVTVLAIAYILVLTWICILGTELSARIQNVMIIAQVASLLLFAGVALWKVWSGDAGPDAIDPSWSWFSPFAIDDRDALIAALLIGVFPYWGWESAVNLCEETPNSRSCRPLRADEHGHPARDLCLRRCRGGRVRGPRRLEEFDDDEGIFGVLAVDVLGRAVGQARHPRDRHLGGRVDPDDDHPRLTDDAIDGVVRAYPAPLARIHPRYRTPHIATALVAILAIAWYVPANLISENFLFDSLSALALMIAFYYALSGVACLIYYRRELTKSAWNFVVIGIGPAVGAFLLGYLFVEATRSLADTDASYSGQEIFGVAPPLAIGYGFLLLGAVLMVVWRLTGKGNSFFARHAFETVDPAVASGEVRIEEELT